MTETAPSFLRPLIGVGLALLALASCGPPSVATAPPGSSRPTVAKEQPPKGSSNPEQDRTGETSVETAAEPQPDPHPSAKPSQAAPPAREGEVSGLKAMLDDGSYLFIPYANGGLDYCSAVVVHVDGTRTPHRPPDARSKCSEEWAAQDAGDL